MNSNQTMRAITSKHAKKLNNILKSLAEKQKFDKFDIYYIENPFKAVLDQWVKNGGEIFELIEPVDSLHPTQVKHISNTIWTIKVDKRINSIWWRTVIVWPIYMS